MYKKKRIFNKKETHPISYIRKVLEDSFNVVTHENKRRVLRVSSLPFCGLLYVLDILQKKKIEKSYSFEFYTRSGTAIHSALQDFIPLSKYGKQVYGNWRCSNYKNHETQHDCDFVVKKSFRPENLKCPACKKAARAKKIRKDEIGVLRYEELEYIYKDIASGHSDLVTADKTKSYLLWEFKSTSQFNILNPEKYLPYPKHIIQVETYSMLLKELENIRPSHYILVYVSRDMAQQPKKDGKYVKEQPRPVVFSYKVTDKILIERKRQLDQAVKAFTVAEQIIDSKRLDKKLLRELQDLRPCKSREDYDKLMTHSFFGQETCPFYDDGKCFKKGCGSKALPPTKQIIRLIKSKNGKKLDEDE